MEKVPELLAGHIGLSSITSAPKSKEAILWSMCIGRNWENFSHSQPEPGFQNSLTRHYQRSFGTGQIACSISLFPSNHRWFQNSVCRPSPIATPIPWLINSMVPIMLRHALEHEGSLPALLLKSLPLTHFSLRKRNHKADGSDCNLHPSFMIYAELSYRILRTPSPPCDFSLITVPHATRWGFRSIVVSPRKNLLTCLSIASQTE